MLGQPLTGLGHHGGHLDGMLPGRPGRTRTNAGLPFGGGGPSQRIRLSANGIGPLLRRADGQARLDLECAGALGGGLHLLPQTR